MSDESTFNPAEYGIVLTDPVGSLSRGVESYKKLISSASTGFSAKSLAEIVKDLKEEAKRRGEITTLRHVGIHDIRSNLFADDNDMSLAEWYVTISLLDRLVRDVKDFVEYLTEETAKEIRNATRPVVQSSPEQAKNKEHAEKLRTMLNGLAAHISPMLEITGEKLPDNVKLKTMKNGTIKVDLPDLPGKGNTNGTAGRVSVFNKVMRYRWNGQEIPAGTTFDTIAHRIVSDVEHRFTVKTLEAEIVRQCGEDAKSSRPGNSWSVILPTGRLDGSVPASLTQAEIDEAIADDPDYCCEADDHHHTPDNPRQ